MGWGEDNEMVAHAVLGRRCSPKGWIRTNCPLCELRVGKNDRKSSFGFHVTTLRYECFRCGATGRLKQPPEEYGHLIVEQEAASQPILGPPEGFYPLCSPEARGSMVLEPAWAYVRDERGLSEGAVERAGIGACVTGRFAGRIIIPVTAADGAWLWYVGRVWTKKADKPYLYPSGGRAGVMFNHAALLVETDEPALGVEGCFDALSLDPDAVAVLGKPTEENIWAFACARRPIAMILDGDAHEEGWAISMRLRLEGQRAGTVRLPPRVDPDEIPADVLRLAARRCIDEGEVILLFRARLHCQVEFTQRKGIRTCSAFSRSRASPASSAPTGKSRSRRTRSTSRASHRRRRDSCSCKWRTTRAPGPGARS